MNSFSVVHKIARRETIMLRRWIQVVGISLIVIMAACAGPKEFTVSDQRETLGQVFTEQTGNIDNSGSDTDLSQDVSMRREFRHSIDLKLNNDSGLDRRTVEDRILEAYDLPDSTGEKVCIVLADVPGRAVYQYDVEWTQVLREGNIEEGNVPGQGNLLGTYTIVVDLQCQTLGVTQVR
jgi:hypothetical protein